MTELWHHDNSSNFICCLGIRVVKFNYSKQKFRITSANIFLENGDSKNQTLRDKSVAGSWNQRNKTKNSIFFRLEWITLPRRELFRKFCLTAEKSILVQPNPARISVLSRIGQEFSSVPIKVNPANLYKLWMCKMGTAIVRVFLASNEFLIF